MSKNIKLSQGGVLTAEGTSTVSKLNLVDLAGSERCAKTGTQGQAAKEAIHINKSLSMLEQVSLFFACFRPTFSDT